MCLLGGSKPEPAPKPPDAPEPVAKSVEPATPTQAPGAQKGLADLILPLFGSNLNIPN